MSSTIEWVDARFANPRLHLGDEELADGAAPNDKPEDGRIAVTMDCTALYGTPEQVRAALKRGLELVEAHLEAHPPAETPC